MNFLRTMLFLGAIFLVIVLLSGCGTTQAGRAANLLVDRYCDSSVEGRYLMRLEADSVTFPNRIRVECVE